MTIKDCIDIVDNIKPNQYTIKEKVMWLSFIEAIIINEVLKTHEGYDGKYDMFEGYSENKLSVTLIVPSPYDRLYTAYLKMKIDEENGETTRYNNSAALYNNYMAEYKKYYNKTHMPIGVTNKVKDMKPKLISVGLSDAEYENIKRDLTFILTEYFSDAVSPDKIADVVTMFVQNNMEMLKGKDGRDGLDGKDGYTPRKNIDYFDGKQGPQGKQGPIGPVGPTGPAGKTPTEEELKKLINNVISLGKFLFNDTLEIEAPKGASFQGDVNTKGTHNIAGAVCFYDGDVTTYSKAWQWGEQIFLGDVKFPAASKPWFKNPPKIGGTGYDDPSAGEAMSIVDLGVHFDINDAYYSLNSKTSKWATITLQKTKIINYNMEFCIPSDTDHTYTVYAQYNGEDTDGYYYKTFFVYDSMHNGDTPFGLYVKTFQYDSTSGEPIANISTKFMFEDDINCPGYAWFANAPKIGGTSYNDPEAQDVMSIKDLGEITTQEQLDDLRKLPAGIAIFKCAYTITANAQYGFKLGELEYANGATFGYSIETIYDTSIAKLHPNMAANAVQILKASNWEGSKPVLMYRRYYLELDDDGKAFAAHGNYGYNIYINGDDILFEEDGKIESKGALRINSVYDTVFNKPIIMAHPKTGLELTGAFGANYFSVANGSEIKEYVGLYSLGTDTTYTNTVESLSITIDENVITAADGLYKGIHFNTGENAPSVSYTVKGNTIINWQGTDCALDDGKSVFAPSANMHYDIFITYMGGNVIGAVKGYKPATSNQ